MIWVVCYDPVEVSDFVHHDHRLVDLPDSFLGHLAREGKGPSRGKVGVGEKGERGERGKEVECWC